MRKRCAGSSPAPGTSSFLLGFLQHNLRQGFSAQLITARGKLLTLECVSGDHAEWRSNRSIVNAGGPVIKPRSKIYLGFVLQGVRTFFINSLNDPRREQQEG